MTTINYPNNNKDWKMSEEDKLRLRAYPNKSQKSTYAKPSIQKALKEGDIQEVIDNLSMLQRRFAEEYLVDYNASQAYIRAGGNSKHPYKAGWRLLQHPGIKAAIDQITLQRAGDAVIKPEYVVRKIVKTIEKAEEQGNHNAVLRGCELMARHLGMFIERQEISGPNGDAIQLKQVKDAADAFTSAVAGLVERGGERAVLKLVK